MGLPFFPSRTAGTLSGSVCRIWCAPEVDTGHHVLVVVHSIAENHTYIVINALATSNAKSQFVVSLGRSTVS